MAASDRLYTEIAFVAYHFHWSLEEVLGLEHGERRRFCEHISRINKAMSAQHERRGVELGE